MTAPEMPVLTIVKQAKEDVTQIDEELEILESYIPKSGHDPTFERYQHEKLSYPIHIQEQWLTAFHDELFESHQVIKMTKFPPVSSLDELQGPAFYDRISALNGKITALAQQVQSAPSKTGQRMCEKVEPNTPWYGVGVKKTGCSIGNYNRERGISTLEMAAGVQEYKDHNIRVVGRKKEGLNRVRTLYQKLHECCNNEIEKNGYNKKLGSLEKQDIISKLNEESPRQYTLSPDDKKMQALEDAKTAAKQAQENYQNAYKELNTTIPEKLDEIRLQIFLKEIKENIWPVTHKALPGMTFANLVAVVLREGELFKPGIPLLNGYLPESCKQLVWNKLTKEKSITEEMVWGDGKLKENIKDAQTLITGCNKKLEGYVDEKGTKHHGVARVYNDALAAYDTAVKAVEVAVAAEEDKENKSLKSNNIIVQANEIKRKKGLRGASAAAKLEKRRPGIRGYF